MKRLVCTIAAIGMTVTVSALAQPQLDGSFGAFPWSGGGFYNSTTLQLGAQNIINSGPQGDFNISGIAYGSLTAYSIALTGLSSTPKTENIPDFFVFAGSQDLMPPGYQSPGTTPNNRFTFTLQSLKTEGSGFYYGTGTLIDTTAAYGNTPAAFTVGFSGSPNIADANYSFSFATMPTQVPEPGTVALFSVACLCVLPLFRRKVQMAGIS